MTTGEGTATSEPAEVAAEVGPSGLPPDEGRKATLIIAAAAGVTGASFNIWYPFLPLYALELGAENDADAVAWVALAITSQGIARLSSSFIWGYLSDRWGRKMMLLRSLYLASLTCAVAAAAQAPWHLSLALACQGLFSGFVPASVALVSVSVPDHRLNRSLSTVTGAQHLGMTTGPAAGALLALFLGFRESIIVAAFVPMLTATAVLLWVPRDRVTRPVSAEGRPSGQLEPFKVTAQFVLAVAAFFCVFSMNEVARLATPISLKAIVSDEAPVENEAGAVVEAGAESASDDEADVAGEVGLAFMAAGAMSAFSVLFLAPLLFRPGRMGRAMGAASALGAVGFLVLALSDTVPAYIGGFLLVSMVISSMIPAINTLIANSVTRSRRGTGFGIAATVQAFSFAVGPGAAALFAAVSLEAGFVVLALLFLALGVALLGAVREHAAALHAG